MRENPKRIQISIRITTDLLDRLQSLAKKERRTRSNMSEYLLREKIREIEQEEAKKTRSVTKQWGPTMPDYPEIVESVFRD